MLEWVYVMKEKTIGVLGGMGPEATVELLYRIIKVTPAKRDQDHLRILVDNNPKIPDRTAAILGHGADPFPQMAETAKNLERAGANFIIIPCNAAHHYLRRLQDVISIPILNMIELTVQTISDDFPEVKAAGLMAATGTLKAQLYDRILANAGIKVLVPDNNLQEEIMKAIYKIKAGCEAVKVKRYFVKSAKNLIRKGAEVIVNGCTEISIALKNGDLPVPIIDPLQILAEKAVALALTKEESIGKVVTED